MNILITGARAPISADIARTLAQTGHAVFMADSVHFPIGRFSPYKQMFIRYPAPRKHFAAFSAAIGQMCDQFKIDAIIPTSEETFWLSMLDNLPEHTCLRTSPLPTLHTLHSKWAFAQLAISLGYGITGTRLITSKNELDIFMHTQILDALVLKPVYSRFATKILIGPSIKQVHALNPSADNPWISQPRIHGVEYCLYNIAESGKLLLHTAYQPRWRAGKGAGVYFEPIQSEELRTLSEAFIAETHFTGQISFDVIKADSSLFVLECNPRGTSGAHLLAQHPQAFERALLGHACCMVDSFRPMMLTLPLILYNPGVFTSRTDILQLCRAHDAMRSAGVSIAAQLLTLIEVLARATSYLADPLSSTTRDMEWNGERAPGANHA